MKINEVAYHAAYDPPCDLGLKLGGICSSRGLNSSRKHSPLSREFVRVASVVHKFFVPGPQREKQAFAGHEPVPRDRVYLSLYMEARGHQF